MMSIVLALLLALASAEKAEEIPPVLRGSDGQVRLMSGVPLPPRTTGTRVVIAIIDTGIMTSHPQLAGLVIAERDFTGEGLGDRIGHGTLVALQSLRAPDELATMRAELDFEPPAIFLVNAKVASKTTAPTADTLKAAIEWSVAQGAYIVNLSVGVKGEAEEFLELCDAITAADALFFAAEGDPQDPTPVYPAACAAPNLQSVAIAAQPSSAASLHVDSSTSQVVDRSYFYAEEGRRASADGDLATAKRLLGESLKMEETPRALFYLSTILTAEGDNAAAVKHLRRALELDPKDPPSSAQLGSLLLKDDKPAEAIPYLRIAVDGFEARAAIPYRINLAIALVRTDNVDGGRAELQRVLELDPRNTSARELLTDLERLLKARNGSEPR